MAFESWLDALILAQHYRAFKVFLRHIPGLWAYKNKKGPNGPLSYSIYG